MGDIEDTFIYDYFEDQYESEDFQKRLVIAEEWIKKSKETVYGNSPFAPAVRGIIFHWAKYKEISVKQRKTLIAYILSDDSEKAHKEFEEKWDIPF